MSSKQSTDRLIAWIRTPSGITLVVCWLGFAAVGLVSREAHHVLSPEAFLPTHTIAEFLSIIVSIGIFLVSWHAAEGTGRLSLVLGNSFLYVGLIDLLHTLSYRGMPPFVVPSSAARATTYWMTARIVGALALLAAAVLQPRISGAPARRVWGAAFALAAAGFTFSVVTWRPNWLPPMYDEQALRLTPTKVALEYCVIALHLASIAALVKLNRGDQKTREWLLCGLTAFIFSELSFTLYSSVYDLYNLLGHVLKVAGSLFVYQAVFVMEVQYPYRRLALEREVTSRLQQILLPRLEPRMPGLETGSFYITAAPEANIGGDLFDLFSLAPGRYGMAIADVAGKGVSAAVEAFMVKHTLRAYARECDDPTAVVSRVNSVVAAEAQEDSFVTLFYGVLDVGSGSLIYCNAGHEPPILIRASGRIEWLEPTATVLAGLRSVRFACARTTLAPLDLLVLYTDGLTDARRGPVLLGPEGVAKLVHAADGDTAHAKAQSMLSAIKAMRDIRLSDDATVLFLKYSPTLDFSV